MAQYEGEQQIKLDDIDEILIWELAADGRKSNNELARKAGIAPSTCHVRIKRLENLGVIQSVHAALNYESIGFPVQAIVAVRLQANARDQVKSYANRIIKIPQVLNVFFVGGADDFLVHVACTSSAQLRDLVALKLSASPVASTNTSILFDHLIGVQFMQHVSGLDEMRRPIRIDPHAKRDGGA